MASVDSLTESFNTDVKTAIDINFPLKSVKIHLTDRPWMTSRIKQLILERQRAFHSDKSGRWRELRTRVRDEIAARKKAFYPEKVSFLKNTDPRKWWSLVNKLSSKSCGASAISYEVDRYYLTLPAFLPAPDELPAIRPTEVYKKLLKLSPFKACGPDAIQIEFWSYSRPSFLSPWPLSLTGRCRLVTSPRRGEMPIYHQYQRRHPSPVTMTCDQ